MGTLCPVQPLPPPNDLHFPPARPKSSPPGPTTTVPRLHRTLLTSSSRCLSVSSCIRPTITEPGNLILHPFHMIISPVFLRSSASIQPCVLDLDESISRLSWPAGYHLIYQLMTAASVQVYCLSGQCTVKDVSLPSKLLHVQSRLSNVQFRL